jgi:hypothetical protein
VLTLVLAASLSSSPAPSPLADAEAQYFQMNYKGTLDALAKVKPQKDLPRAMLLRMLELEGLTAAHLKLTARAQEALRRLFVLDPEHAFGSFAPRVNTQLLEARGWAKAQGALTAAAAEPKTRPGAVEAIGVVVTKDPLALVMAVRFHTREAGGAWQASLAPLMSGAATVTTGSETVEWWAQVLGGNDAVLLELGDASHPLVTQAPPLPEPARPLVERGPAPSEPVTLTPGTVEVGLASRRARVGPWVTLGAGALAAGLGAGFGLSTANARARLDRPVLDADGVVVGLSQAEAQRLHGQMQRDAWVANVGLGLGVALAITALVWLLLDR